MLETQHYHLNEDKNNYSYPTFEKDDDPIKDVNIIYHGNEEKIASKN